MADLTLNRFHASGSTADRTAFTPTPPTPASGPDHGYTWFDTDDSTFYAWDGAAWVATGGGGSGTVTHTAGALTLNKLALGAGADDLKVVTATDGQIPIGKTSDGTVTLGAITAGVGISVTNGAASITIAATGTSGLTLLEQHTASASASLDFTSWYSSTYDEYIIECVQLVPATNAVNILLRVSTNAGVSYDSGSNYSWASYRASAAGATQAGSASTSSLGLDGSGTQSNSSTTGGFVGSIRMFNPGGGAMYTRFRWESGINDGTGNPDVTVMGAGSYKSITAVDAFQVLASSGNITSGIVRIYGLAK
jgi:hypothetical protein